MFVPMIACIHAEEIFSCAIRRTISRLSTTYPLAIVALRLL